jgi:cell volume regulation protein A
MYATLLILLGGIIGVGFISNLFFEKTRLPGVLLLIAVGILLGPVTRIVPPEAVRAFMPAFGAVALTIILFEGGLDLNLQHTIRQAVRAVLLAILSFMSAMFLVYYALVLGLNAGGPTALAISAALACTSAPIVIPVLARVAPESPMRPLLVVESALSDALAVMVVLAFIGLEHGDISGSLLASQLGKSLLIGAVAAMASGLVWLWLLSRLYQQRFFYLMTIGVVFLLMGVVESFHGSGVLAVLVFGMMLANGQALLGIFRPKVRTEIDKLLGEGGLALNPRLSESHAEVSFMTRSFFFVYLGMIFQWPGADFRIWLTILLTIIAIIVAREIAVQLTGWITRVSASNRLLLSAMLPRGLATAVLAAILVNRAGAEGMDSPPAGPSWESLATFVVLASNIWMSVRLWKISSLSLKKREEKV